MIIGIVKIRILQQKIHILHLKEPKSVAFSEESELAIKIIIILAIYIRFDDIYVSEIVLRKSYDDNGCGSLNTMRGDLTK